MLITTTEEIKQFLTSFAEDNNNTVKNLQGAFDNSENDFLMEKIGRPLLAEVNSRYAAIPADKVDLMADNADQHTPWLKLIVLCQRIVVFDAFSRNADIVVVSIHSSGMNQASATDYAVVDKDTVERFKNACIREAHAAVNRLLVQLEEWAEASVAEDADEDVIAITALWKQSRYYYQAAGLFINTATKFNEFVDIYENRSKFISLLPDLRYVHDFYISAELGDDLTADLLAKHKDGTLNTIEAEAVRRLQRSQALFVESRNKMFKRPDARDEAINSLKNAMSYIAAHQADFDQTAIVTAPFYKAPVVPTAQDDKPRHERKAKKRYGCFTPGID